MPDPSRNVLPYESAADAPRRWGPWLWRPSRLSIALLLVVAGLTTWVTWRHEPWAIVWSVHLDHSQALSSLHLPREDRVVLGSKHVRVWDVNSARLLAEIRDLRELDSGFIGLTDGRVCPDDGPSVALWSLAGNGIVVIDPEHGTIKRRDWLGPVRDVSADGRRLIVSPSSSVGGTEVWEWEGGYFHEVRSLPGVTDAAFAGGGTPHWREVTLNVLLQRAPSKTNPIVAAVVDPSSLATVLMVRSTSRCEVACTADGQTAVVLADPAQPPSQIELKPTAARRCTVLPPPGTAFSAAVLSADGRRLAASLGSLGSPTLDVTSVGVWELPSGRLLYHRPAGETWIGPPLFFPDNRRLLLDGVRENELWVGTTEGPHPLAILSRNDAPMATAVSPSGKVAAAYTVHDQLTVWRQVGYECRESILGLLGMPHVWTLIASATLLALVLWRDAGRRRDKDRASHLLALAMVLVGTAMSLMLFLDGCLGHWQPNPGPLLLLAGLGLAVGARGWRWISLAVLAGSLALAGWGLQQFLSAGVARAIPLRILDRVWDVPASAPTAALAAAIAATAAAIVLLARRGRL